MRYQRILSQIWDDEKFRSLSQDGKLLFFYLLTNNHSNQLGIYSLPIKYIECDINWSTNRLVNPFKELQEIGLIIYDYQSRLVCIKNQLKHNPINGPKQVIYAERIISSLPKSSIFSYILRFLDKPYHKPLIDLINRQNPDTVLDTQPDTVSHTVSDTEPNTVSNENPIGYPERYGIAIINNKLKIKNNKKGIPLGIPKKDNEILLPEWLDKDLWIEFKKYRKEIKSPLTLHAEKLCLADLKQQIDSGHNQQEVINQTIKSGKWKSFYPVHTNGQSYSPSSPYKPRFMKIDTLEKKIDPPTASE